MAKDRRGLAYVAVAVFFFSLGPVLTRWASPLSPYEIVTGRLALASLLVLVAARLTWQNRPALTPLRRRDIGRLALFGLVAAIHFVTFTAALSYTTIAHALAVTYTSPIFVTLFSAWWLKEPVPPWKWLGVAVAVGGIAILVGFEPLWDERMLLGDGLALLSAISFGIYSVAGRSQRARLPLLVYAGLVYGAAAVWMLPLAAASFTPAYGLRQVLSVIGLGVGPLGIGHTLYNAALRRTHATAVNLIATQEVTGGILLGWLLLHETPGAHALIGAAITILGAAIVIL